MPGREKHESPSAGLMLRSTIKIQAVIWNEFSHCFRPFGCGVRFGEGSRGGVNVGPLKSA